MAQADNSTGVGMAPQYTSTGSSIRQPSVNYQATVRLPDAPLENRVREPKTDWVNYALSETGRALEAYNKLSASRAQASTEVDKEAIKKAEEEEDRAWRNQLARETSRIAESVRQGTMTIEAADTAYRALGDRYIAAGYDEEKVSKVIGRQDAGVRSLVQTQYSQSLTKELDRQAQQANTFMSENPGFRNMPIAKVNSILQQVDNDMDNLARIQQRQNNYEPGSEEWYTYKALADEIINKNTTMMVARHVGNLLEKYGNVTPNNVQEITNRSLDWAVKNQISASEAQVIINRCYERMGVDTLKSNWIDTLKISADSANLATQAIMADAKLSVMGIPGVAVYQELGGDTWKQSVMTSLSMNKNFQTGVEGIVNEVVDSVNRDYTNIPPEATGAMIQGTNNIYANGSSTPFTRVSTALATLRLINQNNKVTRETADGNATIALNNLNGTSERLNITAIERDVKILKSSDKPDMQTLGEKTEEELAKLKGNKIAAEFLTPNSPMYQTVNGLIHSLNASELKYDENGKAFLSGTSGFLGDLGLAFRGVGGEGSYLTQLNRLNASLEGETPEVKKQALEALGFKHAVRGEVSALGSRDGVPQTIDRGEQGAELYTFSDGTVARNETGVEELPESMPRSLQQAISDWWKSQKQYERPTTPTTTTSRLSSSSSQTYDVAQPAVYIESDEGNPNIMYDPVNNRVVDPRDLRQDFGDTSISRGQTPSRLEDFHKDLLISQETLDKKPNLTVYKDSLKHDTIGYGHKLTEAEKASNKFKDGITEEQAWEMFVKDYAQAERDVDSLLKEKEIEYIPEAARLILVNMAYNMGKGYTDEKKNESRGLKSFTNMFKAIKEGNVDGIVREMKKSDWYKQVTSRAETLMQLMREAYTNA